MLFRPSFEFELKCVDGWHKKSVKTIETLDYAALLVLMRDGRIRTINN